MAWNYSEKVKDHFLNPRNVGEIPNATVEAEVGSMACGDALKLYLQLDENEKIVDAKFQTFGCGSAIASSSALTEMIKGKTLEDAAKITNDDIAAYLDGLPEAKMHCSVMGKEALDAAVAKFRGHELKEDHHDEGKIVCHCFGVTDERIKKVVKENFLTTVEQVTNYTKAGGGCKSCHPAIEDLILQARKELEAEAKNEFSDRPMTNLEKIMKIKQVMDLEVKPALNADGGDIDLVDVDGHKVMVRLRGSCSSCMSSQVTLKMWVEKRLQELVAPELEVIEVR